MIACLSGTLLRRYASAGACWDKHGGAERVLTLTYHAAGAGTDVDATGTFSAGNVVSCRLPAGE